MLELEFCHQCEKDLRAHGDFVYEAFEYVCFSYLEGVPLEVSDKNFDYADNFEGNFPHTVASFLERKGYVITTECGLDRVLIKPLHVLSIDVGDETYARFCLHDC